MSKFPPRGNGQPPQMAMQQMVHLPPEAQRACGCGATVFIPAFYLYELPSQVIGQKSLTAAQIFVCVKCGMQAGEHDLKPVIQPQEHVT